MAPQNKFIVRLCFVIIIVVSVMRSVVDGQETGKRCLSPDVCACTPESGVPCCDGLDFLQAGDNQVMVYQPGSCMCCKKCLIQNSNSQSTGPNQSSQAKKYACSNQTPM